MKHMYGRNLKESYDYMYTDVINSLAAHSMQENIDKITAALRKYQREMDDMRFLLEAYHEREQFIIQFLFTAHIHAQRIELEARRKARKMLEGCESDLKTKKEQLKRLKIELKSIKENHKDRLMIFNK